MVDSSKLQGPGSTSTEQEEAKRALSTKQTFEAAKLESNLRSGEMADINKILEDYERRKKGLASDVGRDMRLKLIKAKSEEERQKILLEYAPNLHKYTDALEKQKQQQLEGLRRKLVDRRRQARKELHKAQIADAKKCGVSPDCVPPVVLPSHDELDHDLRMLTV